jgi:hypothetical protein
MEQDRKRSETASRNQTGTRPQSLTVEGYPTEEQIELVFNTWKMEGKLALVDFYKTGSTKATTETPPKVNVPEFLANVRRLTRDLFNQYRDRPDLERIHGKVWDPKQLAEEFEVLGFPPDCLCQARRQRGDGVSVLPG